MTSLKIKGPVDLEKLADDCGGVTCDVRIGNSDGELALLLSGPEARGCAELLSDWLRMSGVEILAPVW